MNRPSQAKRWYQNREDGGLLPGDGGGCREAEANLDAHVPTVGGVTVAVQLTHVHHSTRALPMSGPPAIHLSISSNPAGSPHLLPWSSPWLSAGLARVCRVFFGGGELAADGRRACACGVPRGEVRERSTAGHGGRRAPEEGGVADACIGGSCACRAAVLGRLVADRWLT